jgi:tetrahydromethanopterin S-methyltransferase subunit G
MARNVGFTWGLIVGLSICALLVVAGFVAQHVSVTVVVH